ncbi:MAG: phosphate ABC transporter permease [Anaerolinea sp.]|nr:phosphate ABC transporter permease [Anaerolinea sp.]
MSDEITMIKPSRGWVALNLKDLWKYRELVYFLIWRDIKVRYKQAALGVAWAIIQPILTMVIFSVVFGKFGKLPTDNSIPYPLFTFAALLPWQLFANALQRSGTSLVGSAHLITKIYFPRLIIPISAVVGGLVDFAISFVVLIGMIFYFKVYPTWNMLWIIPFTLLTLITALAVGLWLSAMNVRYRDVQQMIPFLIQAWMFASPVAYSARMITDRTWQLIYGLNPLAGIIQGFRWSLLGGTPPGELMWISSTVMVILFISGLYYFRRMEKTFADTV